MEAGVTLVVGWGVGLACAGLTASLVLVLAEVVRMLVRDVHEAGGATQPTVRQHPTQPLH